MTCSPARLAANQRNAQQSTGPRTAEGKAASRLNAFRHGGAGAGDLLGPGDNAAEVERRATAFGSLLGAEDEVGWTLTRRAALLSVRMEQAAERDMASVRAQVLTAYDEFDRGLAGERDQLIAALTDGANPRAILADLALIPAGVAYLITAWRVLRGAVATKDQAAVERAWAWLGLEIPTHTRPGELEARIEAEVHRLQLALPGVEHAVSLARDEAGVLAGFDPGPEANLARRYEAAAERGWYRALRALADHRRTLSGEVAGAPARPLGPVVAASPPTVPPRPGPPSAPAVTSVASTVDLVGLGSFGLGDHEPASSRLRPLILDKEPPLIPQPTRKERPNLAKLAKQRR